MQVQFELASLQVVEQPCQGQFDNVPLGQLWNPPVRLTIEAIREVQINCRVEPSRGGHVVVSVDLGTASEALHQYALFYTI